VIAEDEEGLPTGQAPEVARSLSRPLAAEALSEFVATTMLLIAVVGSGIMAERLSQGNLALALLANSIATGGALLALILAFGPRSGAHMNPVVTLGAVLSGEMRPSAGAAYAGAQLVGAVLGVVLAHAMFDLPLFETSRHARHGTGQFVAEVVATFGLIATILGCRAHGKGIATALAVAAYITGAYWFTASTSFANPAVTIARALTDTFAGIAPGDVPAFIIAQLLGGLAALLLFREQRRP
jgi:glycerol uptake facilitator-like aquaporin